MKLLNRILQIDTSKSRRGNHHVRSVSLNRGFRRRTEQRICAENQLFLGRLQNVRPVYSNSGWARDYQKHLMLRQNASRVQGDGVVKMWDRRDSDQTDQLHDIPQQTARDGGGDSSAREDVQPGRVVHDGI